MNGPVNDGPAPQRTWLERHFLTLAIMATSACACAIVADAAGRDDVAIIDFGNHALLGFLDEPRFPAPRALTERTNTRAAASTSCERRTAIRAGSDPDAL